MSKKKSLPNKLRKSLKKINFKSNNKLYYFARFSTILISLFITISTILQMSWLDPNEPIEPLIIWIGRQPYVGISFFLFLFYFFFTVIYISVVCRPVEIKNMKDLNEILWIDNKIRDDAHYKFRQILDQEEIAYKTRIEEEYNKLLEAENYKSRQKEKKGGDN